MVFRVPLSRLACADIWSRIFTVILVLLSSVIETKLGSPYVLLFYGVVIVYGFAMFYFLSTLIAISHAVIAAHLVS